MDSAIIKYHIVKLTTLARGSTPSGPAPHKPVLLLSIFEWMSQQAQASNKVIIDEQFLALFSKNWDLLVKTNNRKNIFLPLHHLGDGTGWQLLSNKGIPIIKMTSSFKRFKTEGIFGQFDNTFQNLLNDSKIRFLFTNVILDTYFPSTKNQYWHSIKADPLLQYQQDIEAEILKEAKEQYWVTEKTKLKYLRDWKFSNLVKKAYKDTCCISKLQVAPSYGIIEACHILSHAKFGNDSINNGIALCVNLHRAFDNGIISIGDNYEMIFNKKKFYNENTSPYNLSQFKNKTILLPDNKSFHPSLEYLKWHRKEHGF